VVVWQLPQCRNRVTVVDWVNESGYKVQIAGSGKLAYEVSSLWGAGVDTVLNMLTDAGAGFAVHALAQAQVPAN